MSSVRTLTVVSVLALVASLGLLWIEARGVPFAQEPSVHLREGTALLAEEEWVEAAARLRLATAAGDSSLRLVAHHNLGLAALRKSLEGGEGAIDWAREAVQNQELALEIQPGLAPAAWNLELALHRLRALGEGAAGSEAEEARRLLAPFRLHEEEALGQQLRQRLGEVGRRMGSTTKRGPPW
jgi:hypothetical protein